MKLTPYLLTISLCILMLAGSVGCSRKEAQTKPAPPTAAETAVKEAAKAADNPRQLPVRYQRPAYIAATDTADNALQQQDEQYAVKVGANISSTKGPQPLWDIMKRLANLRGMSVSWASDVNKDVLVDVNIRAEDDFFKAVDNLLRQVGYFHEVKENTIIIKFKVTRQYHVSIPYMKGNYASNVGGDFIPTGSENSDTGTDTEGTAKITSDKNEFDLWKNIEDNLSILLDQESTKIIEQKSSTSAKDGTNQKQSTDTKSQKVTQIKPAQRKSKESPYFFIDKSLGLITVTAPLRLQNIIDRYFKNLNKELYRQVSIEAKIVEVFLQDNSKIGIDWDTIFKGLNIQGILGFGNPVAAVADGVVAGTIGQVYPQNKYTSDFNGSKAGDHVPFLSKVSIGDVPFKAVLNALNQQGDAKVLSNPKITTMNGQAAVLSVFKNKTYIKTIEVERGTADSPGDKYTITPGNISEGVALGVLPSIVDDDTVILHLTPITTDLVSDKIEERVFPDGSTIGLPEVNVREMSTMVKVHNGEMLIIGGLIDSVEGKSGKFAPILGDVPILKYLFGVEEKRIEKRELVILLTPKVI